MQNESPESWSPALAHQPSLPAFSSHRANWLINRHFIGTYRVQHQIFNSRNGEQAGFVFDILARAQVRVPIFFRECSRMDQHKWHYDFGRGWPMSWGGFREYQPHRIESNSFRRYHSKCMSVRGIASPDSSTRWLKEVKTPPNTPKHFLRSYSDQSRRMCPNKVESTFYEGAHGAIISPPLPPPTPPAGSK